MRLGIMGGTFDPIHMGHLDVARASADALHLDRVRLLPSNIPPHRQEPGTSAFHRFALVCLAAATDPRFVADDAELLRSGPSYAADTLRELQRQGWKADQLFFLTGADAFAEIATWKEYPALLNLSHFVVCSRPGHAAPLVRGLLPALQDRMVDASEFNGASEVRVILLDAATTDVSSSQVRQALADGASDAALRGLLAPQVDAHIRRHGLYNSRNSTRLNFPGSAQH
ncbi:MAG: nicotinate-nucleotide adenylyltransferase [Vicinamibacterales bacterium]